MDVLRRVLSFCPAFVLTLILMFLALLICIVYILSFQDNRTRETEKTIYTQVLSEESLSIGRNLVISSCHTLHTQKGNT